MHNTRRKNGRKIKLHFNRVNMQRGLPGVWTAHTSLACNGANEVLIKVGGQVVGRTVFNPTGKQPRAYVEFFGDVQVDADGQTVIQVTPGEVTNVISSNQ